VIVAIDGPAGSGKSTVARLLSQALALTYVDTGAMYRAVALACLRAGVPLTDQAQVVDVAQRARIHFGGESPNQRVLLDGEDVTEAIRDPDVTRLSSPVSAVSGVRRALVAHQRALAASGGVVMEGRDIGTVVLPEADLKVFLTASIGERARRRRLDLAEKGIEIGAEEVAAQIEERDQRDSTRADSPLRPAADAIIIDTDRLTVADVVARIVDLAERAR